MSTETMAKPATKTIVETAIGNGSFNTLVAAVKAAGEKGIAGKELTPFLLAEIAGVTQGRSLAANIALAKNNARVGAAIAVAYREVAR